MANDMSRYAKTALVKSDSTLGKEAGAALVKVGGSGLVFMLAAGLLPFITLPMLLVAAVLLGGYLYVK